MEKQGGPAWYGDVIFEVRATGGGCLFQEGQKPYRGAAYHAGAVSTRETVGTLETDQLAGVLDEAVEIVRRSRGGDLVVVVLVALIALVRGGAVAAAAIVVLKD